MRQLMLHPPDGRLDLVSGGLWYDEVAYRQARPRPC